MNKYLVVLTMANRKYYDNLYLTKFTCEPLGEVT